MKKAAPYLALLVVALIGGCNEKDNQIAVNKATLDAIQKFDSDVVFLTSRDNPIHSLRELSQEEIASWSGRGLFDGEFNSKVAAFQEAIGLPKSEAQKVATIGIGAAHTKISNLKTFNSTKPVRLFITRDHFEPTLDDAVKLKFKLEE